MTAPVYADAQICTLEIEGSSERSWSNSESYYMDPGLSDDAARAAALHLAYMRANCLPEGTFVDTVRLHSWKTAFESVIINDVEINGRYTLVEGTRDLTSAANITVTANGSVPSGQTPTTIPKSDLKINNPQNAIILYYESDMKKASTRFFNCIPDIFMSDLKLVGVPAGFKWLPAANVAFTIGTYADPRLNYWENFQVLNSFIKQHCKLPFTNKDDVSKVLLPGLKNVVYRGTGEKPVGAPKNVFRGRARIDQ